MTKATTASCEAGDFAPAMMACCARAIRSRSRSLEHAVRSSALVSAIERRRCRPNLDARLRLTVLQTTFRGAKRHVDARLGRLDRSGLERDPLRELGLEARVPVV